MADRPVKAHLKMKIKAGAASAAPPVGSTLGQYGVNMMDFINPFNEKTQDRKCQPTPVTVLIYEDKSMTFVTKGTPAKTMIKEAIKLKKGSGTPNKDKVGKLTDAQLTQIAEAKMSDLNANDIDAGTARSMGVEIEK